MPLSRISERMKFEVPLMMPAIHSMRLADRPSRSALMIGTPPATAASKATITPFFCAAEKMRLPCVASSALLAVTTCLPCAIASSTRSLAMRVRPISSTTMSTSGERATAKALETTFAFPPTMDFAFLVCLSATCVIAIARPARRRISPALRLRTSQVPPPTVPMPSRPTLMGRIMTRARRSGRSSQEPVLAEHVADAAHGLAQAVLVLDQRGARVVVAVVAEADAGRDRDLRAVEQPLGELDRAERGVGLGD